MEPSLQRAWPYLLTDLGVRPWPLPHPPWLCCVPLSLSPWCAAQMNLAGDDTKHLSKAWAVPGPCPWPQAVPEAGKLWLTHP